MCSLNSYRSQDNEVLLENGVVPGMDSCWEAWRSDHRQATLGFGSIAPTSDLGKSGFGEAKGLKPNWRGMKSEREQGNGMKTGRVLKDGVFLRWEEPE